MAALKCGHHHQGDKHHVSNTQVLADTIQCLDCGNFTDMHGHPLPTRPQFEVPTFQELKALGLVQ